MRQGREPTDAVVGVRTGGGEVRPGQVRVAREGRELAGGVVAKVDALRSQVVAASLLALFEASQAIESVVEVLGSSLCLRMDATILI